MKGERHNDRREVERDEVTYDRWGGVVEGHDDQGECRWRYIMTRGGGGRGEGKETT